MPEITRRSSTRRAPAWFVGKCGAITAHASSDNQNNEPDILNSLLLQRRLPESMCAPIFKSLIGLDPNKRAGNLDLDLPVRFLLLS